MKNRNLTIEEARIRRLLAVGCPVPAENHVIGAPDLIVEVRNPERTEALDFRFRTEYILDLRIKNTSFARLKVEDLKAFPPWNDKNFTWLGDPRQYTPDQKAYAMKSGRKIPYESGLNHRIRKMELEPGDCYEGMLLGWSIWTRISTDYLHGETFPMRIALIDQFGRSHPSVIEVRVDRTATIRMPDFTKKGTGLFERSPQARAVVGREDPRMPQGQPVVSPYFHASSGGLPQHKASRTGTEAEV
ncbi:MAG: hypothetical protein WB755_25410 [Terriglobales bacterium]